MSSPGPSVLQSPEHTSVIIKSEISVPPMITKQSLRKEKQKQHQDSFPHTFSPMDVPSQPINESEMNLPSPSKVSQINLMWLLQQQMQLEECSEIYPNIYGEIVADGSSVYKPRLCAQRLTECLYLQQHRPRDNNIEFWRNLVAEFFAPNAKKRSCLSLTKNSMPINCILPQEAWYCDICKQRPTSGFGPRSISTWCQNGPDDGPTCKFRARAKKKGRNYIHTRAMKPEPIYMALEISAESLPRLFKIKYESGMLEELLYVDIPEEHYTPSGHTIWNYTKVIEHSVYEAARVIREGRLRVVFSSELKSCIWEFCPSRLEVLIDRRSVTPQVNQFLGAAQKYKTYIDSCSEIASASEEFQGNSKKFGVSINELARELDKSLISDLGYTKRYARCLQISEIFNSVKDVMDYIRKYGIGPVEAMARIRRQSTATRVTKNSGVNEVLQQYTEQPYGDEKDGSRRATSPTTSTASSRRPVHQADLIEPKRTKEITENSVLLVSTEAVMDQSPINSETSQNLAAAATEVDANVSEQNETDAKGLVDKSCCINDFSGAHIGPSLSSTSKVNDSNINKKQFEYQLPYWKGELDAAIDDIQFD